MSILKDIPVVKHYAILRTYSITVPGDLRSQQNPGHGYPEHTEQSITYKVFNKRSEWEIEISDLMSRGQEFRAIVVEPATVSTHVKIHTQDTI